MANQGETGTGKHPHKKTSEPFEHHGKAGGEGGQESKGSGEQSRGGKSEAKQGEGGSGRSGQQARGGRENEGGRSQQGGGDDLKAREYTNAKGNVHHHTKTYMEQHKGK